MDICESFLTQFLGWHGGLNSAERAYYMTNVGNFDEEEIPGENIGLVNIVLKCPGCQSYNELPA